MRRITTIAAFAAVLLSAGSAAAQSQVRIGVLSCRGPTASYILGSHTELRCVFRHPNGKLERYRATVNRLGVDVGIYQNTALEWAVYAPTRRVARGDLRGNYGGVAAGASFGLGVGGNALLGGSNNTIALQPLSVQGQTGFGVAAGIAGLHLG